jgi:hypothetical protein
VTGIFPHISDSSQRYSGRGYVAWKRLSRCPLLKIEQQAMEEPRIGRRRPTKKADGLLAIGDRVNLARARPARPLTFPSYFLMFLL